MWQAHLMPGDCGRPTVHLYDATGRVRRYEQSLTVQGARRSVLLWACLTLTGDELRAAKRALFIARRSLPSTKEFNNRCGS